MMSAYLKHTQSLLFWGGRYTVGAVLKGAHEAALARQEVNVVETPIAH